MLKLFCFILQLYFICNGSVEVVSEDGSTVYTTIGKGHFFGETGLVYHCPYHTTARAATNCELFVLTKPDLDFVLTFYPDIRDKIASYTRERLELINKLRLRPAKVSMSKTTKLKGKYHFSFILTHLLTYYLSA